MDKHIAQLFTDKKFNDFLTKVSSPSLLEDLKQEVMLILLEYDRTKLQAIWDKPKSLGGISGLRYFAIRIALNQYRSSTSPFYKKFKRDAQEYIDDNMAVEDIELIDDDELSLLDSIVSFYEGYKPNLYWFDAEIFELYLELGSYRAVSEQVNIPQRTIGTTCKKVKDKLREAYKVKMG
jgi:DNA-directed RNA polymerase specialized sigma24 family protein